MLSRFYVSVLLCVSTSVLAQNPRPSAVSGHQLLSGAAPASAVQVVYAIDGSTLTTYNINPQTFQATQVGTMTVPQSIYPGITMSPNGHFMYYTAAQNLSQQGRTLYVYATDASGAPQSPPVQQVGVSELFSGPVFDPAANFVYAVFAGASGPQYTEYVLERFVFNPNTGALGQPQAQAKYELLSGSGGSGECELFLPGTNPAGSELYDEINCISHEKSEAKYNERAINSQTGALGPDVEIYSWENHTQGFETIQFANDYFFVFGVPDQNIQNQNFVDVYKVQPQASNPLVQCGFSMFDACGDWILPLVHPSAKYVFLTNPQDITQIGEVDLTSKEIVPDPNTIPYEVQQLSPDGSIAYAANDVGTALQIEIYGFDASNGSVTQGGTISVPSDLDSWWTAERY